MNALLRRLARRCETHNKPSQPRVRLLEQRLGLEIGTAPADPMEAYSNPALIDCGHRWCQQRR